MTRMKVMKFGGTSVGSAERIASVARLITERQEPTIVVLSAMAGTTNTLVEISRQLVLRHRHEALTMLTRLKHRYEAECRRLFPDPRSYDRNWTIVGETFFFLEQLCYTDNFTLYDEKKILARGELLSTAMMLGHLADLGHQAVGLPALEYMRTDKHAEPDLGYIREHLRAILSKVDPEVRLFITEGYICRNAFGDIDNLQRGGSDYSATLIGSALGAEEIQIWTDIDGMHNNDPRIVEETQPVRSLRFEEAAELAYFGAKILHPTCIVPAQKAGVPVRLLNTLEPHAPGTLISTHTDKDLIKAVAAKDKLSMVRVRSNHQLTPWSFMAKLFGLFEYYGVPIDMIASAELALSLAVESARLSPELIHELEQIGVVSVDSGLTIVCVVGDLEAENTGFEAQILEALKDIPLWMISYGGSDYNMGVLIEEQYKPDALRTLSQHLFERAQSAVGAEEGAEHDEEHKRL